MAYNDPADPTKYMAEKALDDPDVVAILAQLGEMEIPDNPLRPPTYEELVDMLAVTIQLYDEDTIQAGKSKFQETAFWAKCIREMLFRAGRPYEKPAQVKKVTTTSGVTNQSGSVIGFNRGV